ncbi:hypothetical protein [Paracidovorax avenae]|uniref:hypothetical protein n=1 Tax=Paracidovorax avenae TaxID=80867 RepID=UPI0013141CA6|nr:hypothetical protein [Paracidovorax avenae]
MNRCIYTKKYFQTADGEHILQNFLGARWISSEISSDEAQHGFGATIDVALADGLKEIRNLLGTRGGRGEPGPSLKNIFGSEGTKFTVDPGGKPKIAAPVIKTAQISDDLHQVQVVLGDMKQLGWAVAKLREMYPATRFDIDDLRQQAATGVDYLGERLKLSSALGGDEFFRGALKAAFNLLGASDANAALLDVFDEIRAFILSGTGDCKRFVRWLNTVDAITLPRIGDFDQFVAVFSKDGFVDGYIQFYGEIGFLLRLAENYEGPEFCYGYLVDPFRDVTPAEIRHPGFDRENIPSFDSGSPLPDEAVMAAMCARLSRILERYYSRTDTKNLASIVDDVLLPHDGKKITTEMLNELSQKVGEYIAHRIFMSPPK